MATTDLPVEVRDRLVGLMGEEAAVAWWNQPETAWLGGLVPAHMYASGRAVDLTVLVEVIEAALIGRIPLEGH